MVTCPNCGHQFRARARSGEGTRQSANLKLNANRKLLLGVLYGHAYTNAQMLAIIKRTKLDRTTRKKGTLNASWDYHNVQIDISNLLGGKYIAQQEKGEAAYDKEQGYFIVDQAPTHVVLAKGMEVAEEVAHALRRRFGDIWGAWSEDEIMDIWKHEMEARR